MKIVDMSNNSEIFRIVALQAKIFYSKTSILFKYKEIIDQYADVHEHYYIVIGDYKGNKCLFVSIHKSRYFVRIMCGLVPKNANTCPVLIHPTIPGIIYANIKQNSSLNITYISFNGGKNFQSMKLESNKYGCQEDLCDIKLRFPCTFENEIYFPKEWLATLDGADIYFGRRKYYFFISSNGGTTWKIFPYSNFAVRSFNGGGIIVGINMSKNKIIYSFDQGETFYQISIFDELQIIVNAMKVRNNQSEGLVIFGRNTNKDTFFIAHVDFGTILKRSCERGDYEAWSPLRFNRTCYQGQETVYLKKNPNSLCFDPQLTTSKTSQQCPCWVEDFNCRFHYSYVNDQCVLDQYSDIKYTVLDCESGNIPLYNLNGYE
ncbi:VPS10 domain-containing receptor SorCS3 [Thelohanellus kitauei]|uniref:VPS10 domain-containing receptor SorCS3 n=1 Tax=Thelohanellus kitauei TaxID=669202 RepID=A0A0C2MTH2_THEKT|nr:VPS10 domain-containing receptor SorCS3 [Thelohanellus kitauei]